MEDLRDQIFLFARTSLLFFSSAKNASTKLPFHKDLRGMIFEFFSLQICLPSMKELAPTPTKAIFKQGNQHKNNFNYPWFILGKGQVKWKINSQGQV